MRVSIFTDGGARGNPGPAASGVVIKDEKGLNLDKFGEYLGERTNNFAEYSALIAGMRRARELGATEIECMLDSELVVKQMKREYKVREATLQKLFIEAYNLGTQFKKITFRHIPREKNKEADALVNEVLDNH
ncbi:MAG: hypothetical protein A2261_02815 [Candidatus Magasanikbacteria bacterium RIFOXYA2_FULL_44_8]|uniref:RNase H type-1 domain-containing protein n=1 Tax=Candidatus Magasanikbacteria bacterium RIFOXYA2_FULL_44_8 TaxID=1798696 RepID=A0A1F6NL13_9BACT|nr:MAG: hypothetical protein A2261_02815 [Candidatus Magasanikbacteria bacterium RIFOXYA2_FULL_44_8]